MIHRDENGIITSVDSLSEVNELIGNLEKKLKKASKKGIDTYSDDEKQVLLSEVKELKTLMPIAEEKMKESKNPMELLSFVKQILKLKNMSEELTKLTGDSAENG